MATRTAPRLPSSNPAERQPTKMIPVKGSADLQRRLKIAAAEEGMTYAQLITRWLDVRDRNIARQRAAQPSPLHQPRNLEQL